MKRMIFHQSNGKCFSVNTSWFTRIRAVPIAGSAVTILPDTDGGQLTIVGKNGADIKGIDSGDTLEIHAPYMHMQSFPSSDTFTVPTDVNVIYITASGGGGGGGSDYGYGGAGGHYCIKKAFKVTPGDTLTITIGAGGTGGLGTDGGDGGTTRVANGSGSTLVELVGGEGGPGNAPSNDTHVARGGTNGGCSHGREQLDTGQSCFEYNAGQPANGAGSGGAGLFGVGGNGSSGGIGGDAAANSGAGGGGARRSNRRGGNGGSGYCIIEWWL